MTARYFSFRFSLCFAFMMAGAGAQLPFLPLWMQAKGLSAGEIATVLASMMVSRAVASPLISYIADRLGNRVLVIRTCTAFSLVAYLLLSQAEGFVQILVSACAAGAIFAVVFPLTESYSINSSARLGLDYGRLRLWASLSFLTGSLLSGFLLTQFDAVDAIWMIIAGQASAMVAAFILPPDPTRHLDHAAHAFDGESAKRLLFGSQFTLVVLAVSLGQASHALVNGFSSVYWTSLGISSFTIGGFWTAAVLTEVALFAFSRRAVDRLGFERLMLIGLAGGIVRWVLLAIVTDPWLIAGAQTLHAVTFATLHLGTMHYIRTMIPQRLQNTAQGLYGAISGGMLMAIVTRMAGDVYGSYEGKAFLFMAGVSVIAFVQAVLVFRFIPTSRAVVAR